MIKIAQIGMGYWGPNILRNFLDIENVEVKKVIDKNPDRQNYIKKKYKTIKTGSGIDEILGDKEIGAVIVSTPANLHFEMVKKVLLSNKNCFVEKPLALNTKEAGELIKIAKDKGLILMVGHVFLFNAAVKDLKKRVSGGEIGKVYYIYSQRLNLGRVRSDVNALWNLAPHDISIVLYLLDMMPITVSAIGRSFIQKNIEDVVFMTLKFEDGAIAHFHVSWLDPNKKRTMTVIGNKKMIVYDDVSDNKIQIFDKGIDFNSKNQYMGDFDSFGKFQLIQRAGDIVIPKIDFSEPLKNEAIHFIECIRKGKKPVTDGESGLKVTRIIEAAMESLNNKSIEVRI
jgi:predicted dehydrogenase